jgi:NAD(P)H dehydrogenase (quinone)
MKVLILFYSMYGHIYKMAEAIAQGVKEVPGAEPILRRIPETIPEDVLKKTGAFDAQRKFAHVPLCKLDELPDADAIIFGTPTRFGNMAGQMRNFLDQTGSFWTKGSLIGKVASVFTSTATQHGGQETTITSVYNTLLHHGMIIVGLPYSCEEISNMDEITGGTPYGASTLAGPDGKRWPSENELAAARFQGKHVANIAAKLAK